MLNDTPCVVLEGSGRIADVIAHAAGLPVSQVTISLIHRLLKKFLSLEYDNFTDLMIIEWTKKVGEHNHLLFSFILSVHTSTSCARFRTSSGCLTC